MAAGMGVARGLDCAGNGDLLPILCASVPARVASVFGERCSDSCAARSPARARTLSHCRNPLLHCGRAESCGAATDSGLCCGCVIWREIRAGMDVDAAPRPAHSQQRTADAGDRTQPGMDGRRSDSGDSVHRRTGTRREVSFGLGKLTLVLVGAAILVAITKLAKLV